MRPFLSPSILIATTLATAPGCLRVADDGSQAPDSDSSLAPSTPGEVLDRYVKGLGGSSKLEGIAARTVEARITFHPEAGCTEGDENCLSEPRTGSFILQTTADGRLYRRTLLDDQVEERGFDGKTGWSQGADGLLRIDTPAEAIVSREDALLHWYFDLAKRGVEVTLLPSRTHDSTEQAMTLDGIALKVHPEAAPKALWFDRATGLLREEVIEDSTDDATHKQTILYEDYQAVDGVMVPFKVRVTNVVGKREQVVEFVTQRVSHEEVDEARFAVPKLADPAPQDDPLLASLAKARAAAEAAPKDAGAAIEWARAAFTAAHFDEAQRAATGTLRLNSAEPEALFILARTQLLEGDLGAAARTLVRAKKAGVRDEAAARQEAWIHARRRDFTKLARAFDAANSPTIAGRYRAFVGSPLARTNSSGCVSSVKLVTSRPLVVAEVAIGGVTTNAVLDTGPSEIILAESLARELDVTIRGNEQQPAGGPSLGYGEVKTMKLGEVELQNIPVVVFADSALGEMVGTDTTGVRAVLATNALAEFLITLDVPASKLELVGPGRKCKSDRDARRVGTVVPFWIHETHYLYVRAMMGPAEGIYLLNTGMRGADMTATQAAYSYAGIGAPALRTDEAPMVTVKQFALGDMKFTDLAAAFGYFEQTRTSDDFRLDGMIGLGILGRSRFTLDYETQKLFFTPPSASP